MSAHLCVSLAVTLTTQDSLDSTYKRVMVGSWKKAVSSKISSSPHFSFAWQICNAGKIKRLEPFKIIQKAWSSDILIIRVAEISYPDVFKNSDIVSFIFRYLL